MNFPMLLSRLTLAPSLFCPVTHVFPPASFSSWPPLLLLFLSSHISPHPSAITQLSLIKRDFWEVGAKSHTRFITHPHTQSEARSPRTSTLFDLLVSWLMGSPPPADKDYKATLLSFSFILPFCFYPFPPDGVPAQVLLLVCLFALFSSSFLRAVINSS